MDLLAVQGTLKSLLQHHSLKASILEHSAFFMVHLSHPYMTTGKTMALTRQTFVGKATSLLFNTLTRFVILVAQSCPTLCDPVDCSLPGSSVHEIFQARILVWVAIPSPGDLPNPEIEPRSPALQADSLPTELQGKPRFVIPFLIKSKRLLISWLQSPPAVILEHSAS